MKTLIDYVKSFKTLQREGIFDDKFSKQLTFKDHLRWSVLSKVSEPEKIRQSFIKDATAFKRAKCFNDIYFLVYLHTYRIKGCGVKYCYEVSRRIAFWKGVHSKILYVHPGNISTLRKLGIHVEQTWLEKPDLPLPLQSLDLENLEKFLQHLKYLWRKAP